MRKLLFILVFLLCDLQAQQLQSLIVDQCFFEPARWDGAKITDESTIALLFDTWKKRNEQKCVDEILQFAETNHCVSFRIEYPIEYTENRASCRVWDEYSQDRNGPVRIQFVSNHGMTLIAPAGHMISWRCEGWKRRVVPLECKWKGKL